MSTKKVVYLFHLIIALPKILYVNFRIFSLKDALRLPIFISLKTKVSGINKSCIKIDSKLSTGMVSIGFWGTEGIIANPYTQLRIGVNGCWHVNGKTVIGKGCSICVGGVSYIPAQISA